MSRGILNIPYNLGSLVIRGAEDILEKPRVQKVLERFVVPQVRALEGALEELDEALEGDLMFGLLFDGREKESSVAISTRQEITEATDIYRKRVNDYILEHGLEIRKLDVPLELKPEFEPKHPTEFNRALQHLVMISHIDSAIERVPKVRVLQVIRSCLNDYLIGREVTVPSMRSLEVVRKEI
jgi:hypothetical protein